MYEICSKLKTQESHSGVSIIIDLEQANASRKGVNYVYIGEWKSLTENIKAWNLKHSLCLFRQGYDFDYVFAVQFECKSDSFYFFIYRTRQWRLR